MRIVMLEPLDVPRDFLENLIAPLQAAGHTVLACHQPLSPEGKKERLRQAELLLIANSPLTGEMLQQAKNLQYICVAFTGTDHVDKAACRQMGVKISNAAGYSTYDVAELALGLMLSLLRSLPEAQTRLRAGGTKAGLPAQRLNGKTVGIVGTGAIGMQLARLLSACGCRLLAHSRTKREEARALGMTYLPLEELLGSSDIVSLHTPLNEQTRGLIGREALARMKPGAFLINCARGPVVDSLALAEALHSGQLAGAALDVFDTEPPLALDNPLLQAPNTILTPHLAFYTAQSMQDRALIAFDNISQYLAGNWMRQVPVE